MIRNRALVLGLLAILWSAAPARAGWTSSSSGFASARATTIAPTGTLVASCGLLKASVKLDWSATATPWADGYEVRWGTSSGSYTTGSGTVTAPTVAFTTPALALGTYFFVVRATKGAWRSVNSNESQRTVVSVLGLGTCL